MKVFTPKVYDNFEISFLRDRVKRACRTKKGTIRKDAHKMVTMVSYTQVVELLKSYDKAMEK